MEARFDLVSEKTGRVLLSALFDAASEGLTRRECQKVITILREAQDKLEGVIGHNTVKIRLDDAASSVFWHLVFLRPIIFDADDPWFGGRRWSLLELLENPKTARKLKEMDLGVVYDPDRNWVTIIWEEALRGILDDFATVPSWKKVLDKQERKVGVRPDETWWKTCARHHSSVIPYSRLRREGYLKGVLWHRPNTEYKDVLVFDLKGIDFIQLDDGGNACLPVAKRADFTHFYTEDKQAFHNALASRPRKCKKEHITRATMATKKRRERKKEKLGAWMEASTAIAEICRIMGGGRPGKRKACIPGEEVLVRFSDLANKYNTDSLRITPNSKSKWRSIEIRLDRIERCLNDPLVPREFSIWLRWRDKGSKVLPGDFL